MQTLKRKLASFAPISEEVISFFLQFYKEVKLRKGDFLLKEGQYIRHFFFLNEGCLSYYTLKEGHEQVLEFFTNGDLFTDLPNYVEEKPSNCYIKALENSKLYAISKKDIEECFRKHHELERFGRLFVQDEFLKLAKRVGRVTNLSAEERYLRFIDKRPKLTQVIPQYLIASYLGVTPVGLSKIRRRLSR
ncbi:MAG: Crp/Fnr family transcriptional regulator [Saprospiraceae bacterium]|nr:Crp/Fnr family transcriptional regulator [Saprospiraceae bacterium]